MKRWHILFGKKDKSTTWRQVEKIVRHPQFDAKRLSDDIAVMITSRVVGEASPSSALCFLHGNIVFHCFHKLIDVVFLPAAKYSLFPQTCSTPMSLLPASRPARSSLTMSSATGLEQGLALTLRSHITTVIIVYQSQCAQYLLV